MIRLLRDLLVALIDRQREDTQHKRCERRYWMLSLGLTLVALFAAGAAFCESRRQANAAQTQAGYAQQQLDEQRAENRPWLKTTATVGGAFDYLKDWGSHVVINVTVQNVGKSPAFYASSQTRAAAETHRYKDATSDLESLCKEDLSQAYVHFPQSRASVVFPDDTIPVGADSVGINDQPIDEGYTVRQAPPDSVFLFIYGCAYYAYGTPLTYHHSGYLYILARRDATATNGFTELPLHQNVPQAQLELIPFPVGSDVTD